MDTASEHREYVPLKSGKQPKWFHCNEDCLTGSKYINFAFGALTGIITIAVLVQIYSGDYQIVPHGSVATDSLECSNAGTYILKQGGNAVDAVIASAFCLAVATPYVTGLDAGGTLLIYSHRNRLTPQIIDFSKTDQNKHVPRLISGLFYVHSEYGVLSWQKLLQPAIDLARRGTAITKQMLQAFKRVEVGNIFGPLEREQFLVQDKLAETLITYANIQKSEMTSYNSQMNTPEVSKGVKIKFFGFNIFVPDSPSIGPLLIESLQRIRDSNFTENISKFDYIYKLSNLAQNVYKEPNLTSKYHEGTFSNVAAMDSYDNYASLVTGMYDFLGSGRMDSQGYIPNTDADVEYSRFPILITDANLICGRRYIFGSNNVVSAAQMIMKLLVSSENVTESVESPRFQVLGNGTIGVEDSHLPTYDIDTMNYLEQLPQKPLNIPEPYQSINIVEKNRDDLKSHSDSRGGGIASRY